MYHKGDNDLLIGGMNRQTGSGRHFVHWSDQISTEAICWWQVFYNWPALTIQVDFLVGHTLQDPLERIDAINWWLKLGPYTAKTSQAQLNAWAQIAPTFRMMTSNMTTYEIDPIPEPL